MKTFGALIALGLLAAVLATPAIGAVILVTAAAPLEDDSEEAVQAALDEAVGHAVEHVVQMGLRPVQLTDAQVWSDRVVVQILATDAQRDEGDEMPAPGLPPGEHVPGLGSAA